MKERFGASPQDLAITFNNIGIIYEVVGDYPLSIEYHKKALSIHESLNMKARVSSSLLNLANVYQELDKAALAKSYFLQSVTIKEQLQDRWGISLCYNALGFLYLNEEKMDSSYYYFDQNYKLAKEINAQEGIQSAIIGIAKWNLENNQVSEAIEWANRALENGTQQIALNPLKDLFEILHLSYEKQGSYQKAYYYLNRTKNLADSLSSAELYRKMGFMEAQYNFDKEQLALQKEQLEKEFELNKKIERQETERLTLSVVLIFFLVVGLVIYRANYALKTKNKLLTDKKREIEYLKENLEVLVEERTRELKQKTEQISQYAFNNAHNLRGPL
jgi:tetratricopeptide (TPR) repeat protein